MSDPAGSDDDGAQDVVDLRAVGVWRAGADGRRVRLLHDVTWRVRAGERWAVVGANGAGKSTLLGVVAAEAFPSEGTASILGERLGATDMRVLRTRIGHVDAVGAGAFRPSLTAREVALTGATGTIIPRPALLGPDDEVRAGDLLDLLGVAHLAGRRFAHLSRGERQRVLLARAVMGRPALLLLDEPTEGLDLPGRELFLRAVDVLAHARPELATVQVSHHLEDLAPGTGRALLLRAGGVVACGTAADVLADEPLSRCFGLPIRVTRHAGRVSAVVAEDGAAPVE